MASTPYGPVTRRAVGALILGAAAAPAFAAGKLAPKAHIVTMLGDSITAGYGLPARDALPARLEARLAKLAPGTRVRAAGVSGDTSAGGAARGAFRVPKGTP